MTRSRNGLGILAAALFALLAISLPSAASAKDSNRDRIPDRWERAHKLSLKKDQRKLDQDRDGLRNRGEWLAGTSPRDKDSDDDGVTDLKEKAGVISAYDSETGELTLTLYAGGELTGSVTEDTRVECEDDSADDESSEDGSDDGTDDQGSGDSRDDDSDDESSDDDGTDDQGSGDATNFHSGSGEGHESHGRGRGRGHGKHGDGGNCSVADLAEGVEVTEAEVKYTASGKVFKELEIVVPPAV